MVVKYQHTTCVRYLLKPLCSRIRKQSFLLWPKTQSMKLSFWSQNYRYCSLNISIVYSSPLLHYHPHLYSRTKTLLIMSWKHFSSLQRCRQLTYPIPTTLSWRDKIKEERRRKHGKFRKQRFQQQENNCSQTMKLSDTLGSELLAFRTASIDPGHKDTQSTNAASTSIWFCNEQPKLKIFHLTQSQIVR